MFKATIFKAINRWYICFDGPCYTRIQRCRAYSSGAKALTLVSKMNPVESFDEARALFVKVQETLAREEKHAIQTGSLRSG